MIVYEYPNDLVGITNLGRMLWNRFHVRLGSGAAFEVCGVPRATSLTLRISPYNYAFPRELDFSVTPRRGPHGIAELVIRVSLLAPVALAVFSRAMENVLTICESAVDTNWQAPDVDLSDTTMFGSPPASTDPLSLEVSKQFQTCRDQLLNVLDIAEHASDDRRIMDVLDATGFHRIATWEDPAWQSTYEHLVVSITGHEMSHASTLDSEFSHESRACEFVSDLRGATCAALHTMSTPDDPEYRAMAGADSHLDAILFHFKRLLTSQLGLPVFIAMLYDVAGGDTSNLFNSPSHPAPWARARLTAAHVLKYGQIMLGKDRPESVSRVARVGTIFSQVIATSGVFPAIGMVAARLDSVLDDLATAKRICEAQTSMRFAEFEAHSIAACAGVLSGKFERFWRDGMYSVPSGEIDKLL